MTALSVHSVPGGILVLSSPPPTTRRKGLCSHFASKIIKSPGRKCMSSMEDHTARQRSDSGQTVLPSTLSTAPQAWE
jgi:hypothetical protein